jgi:c-di-GMP-binding flagellar brake protein YcgR
MTTATATAEPLGLNDEESRCTIRSQTEIVFLLRSIMKHNSLITTYFNGGRDFILTSIVGLTADNRGLLLDLGPDDGINRKLLDSDKLMFTTMHERVKVKFSGASPKKVVHKGHPAFQVAIPAQLVRMQRREFYRISTGVITPLKCQIGLPETPDQYAEVTVLDLSVGGLALIDQHHAIDLEPGNTFANCRINLPGHGIISTGLQVCNTFEMTLRNGLACKRSGCRFVDITESDRGLVQRYITQQEREQRSKGLLG